MPDEEEQQRDGSKRKRAMQAEERDAAEADDIKTSGEICLCYTKAGQCLVAKSASCMAMHAQLLLNTMSVGLSIGSGCVAFFCAASS